MQDWKYVYYVCQHREDKPVMVRTVRQDEERFRKDTYEMCHNFDVIHGPFMHYEDAECCRIAWAQCKDMTLREIEDFSKSNYRNKTVDE